VNPISKHTLRALLCVCVCALILPLSAPAASTAVASSTPCWKTLLNEWYGGSISHVYPIPCYQQAINHLPTDIAEYSSAAEDIQHALQLAIAHQKNPKAPLPTITNESLGTTGATGAKGVTAVPGRPQPVGPVPKAIGDSSSGGTTSFPLPLIILGGLAIFLLAAGGVGLIIRRMQGRGPGTP
jgi:hypothetical protein